MIEIIIPPCSSLVSIPALSLSLFNVLAKWKISMTQLNKYMLYFFFLWSVIESSSLKTDKMAAVV